MSNVQNDLSLAIAAVESAETAYQSAAAQTAVDQTVVQAAQGKLDVANAQVVADQQSQAAAGLTLNAALEALVVAANAAKIP